MTTSIFDIAGAAYRAIAERDDITALMRRAQPFIAAYQNDPNLVRDILAVAQKIFPDLAPPTSGYSVQFLQESLDKLIDAGLTVDGKMGKATEAAVMVYQQRKGLTVDGLAGGETFGAILKDLAR